MKDKKNDRFEAVLPELLILGGLEIRWRHRVIVHNGLGIHGARSHVRE
jgi:hypothetical protein